MGERTRKTARRFYSRGTLQGHTPSTVRPWARGFCPHGRPGPLGFGLCGRLPRHGVGGFMFNSPSSAHCRDTPPQVKPRCALSRSGYAQYPAHRGRALAWLGFRRMLSEISPAVRPVGHFSAKFACEIGLKAPSNIDAKRPTWVLWATWESSVWPSERPAAILLGFWAAFEATSWGSRWGTERLAARLPLTTQLDFEPLRRFVSAPHHRDMSTSRVEWLGTEVVCACVASFHGPMDEFRRSRTVRSCSAGRRMAELWRVFPPQPNEPALPARCASARFVLSIAKQQRDPFSRGH